MYSVRLEFMAAHAATQVLQVCLKLQLAGADRHNAVFEGYDSQPIALLSTFQDS